MVIPFDARLLQMVNRLGADPDNVDQAKGLFRWSILYMFGICLLLVLSRLPLAVNFDVQSVELLKYLSIGSMIV